MTETTEVQEDPAQDLDLVHALENDPEAHLHTLLWEEKGVEEKVAAEVETEVENETEIEVENEVEIELVKEAGIEVLKEAEIEV